MGKSNWKGQPYVDFNEFNKGAFGRLRVAEPYSVFDCKQIHDKSPLLFDEVNSGGSETSVWSREKAGVTMTVTANTEYITRQSFRRMDYQPGKSQLIFLTGNFNGQETNVTKQIGLHDQNDGIFLEVTGTDIAWVVRNNGSDTRIAQNDWSEDILNGSRQSNNQSGVNLDISKVQIMVIDYEWLGVGSVRVGFVIDEKPIYVHHFHHANIETTVYMQTPNLPVRYHIISTGVGGTGSLNHNCATVMSEGGREDTGTIHGVSLGTTNIINANIAGTVYALLGIKLKSTHLDQTVKLETFSILSITNDNFEWVLLLDPTVAGTFTYNSIADDSIEVAKGNTANPSTTTVTGGHIVACGYGASLSAGVFDFPEHVALGSFIDGTPQELVLCVRPVSSNADYLASLNWREI